MNAYKIREGPVPKDSPKADPRMSLAESALTRWRRGEKHIETLKLEMADVLAGSKAQFRPWINQGHLVLTVDDQGDLPVNDWAVLIGDAVVNLRAALDHVIWSLSVAHRGPPSFPLSPEWRGLQFPICLGEDTWSKIISDSTNRQIWALRPDLTTVLEKFQPFTSHRPRHHPLWILKELANLNKHRALPVLARRLPLDFLTVSPAPLQGRLLGGRVIAPFAGTQEIARVELQARYTIEDESVPSIGDTMRSILSLKLDMNVVFGKGVPGAGRDVIATLNASSRTVRAAIEELAAAHGQPPMFW